MQCASVHPHPHLRYQQQDCALTLGEGLEEYYAANEGIVTRPGDLPSESRSLFRSHDLCHVVFGLDTTLDDEVMADARTLFSCDVGLRRYWAYLTRDQQAKDLFRELGYVNAIRATALAVPRIVRAAVEALRMTRRWPWTPPEFYLGRPLAELRSEFRICVI
jgi:hypothetical protein